MDSNKKIGPPRLPGQAPKIDTNKLNNSKENAIKSSQNTTNIAPMSAELNKYQSSSVVRQQEVKQDNPVLVLSFKHKKLVISLIAIVLSLLIATGIIFAVLPKPTKPVDVFIKFEVSGELQLIEMGSTVPQGEIQKVMPGDAFSSKFTVRNIDELQNNGQVYVRVRLVSYVKENQERKNAYYDVFNYNLEGNNNWFLAGDGFLYYKDTLKANTEVEICNKLILNKELGNEFQGKEIEVEFEGQCLQAGPNTYKAIEEEWPTAPYQWKQMFDERGSQA